MGCRVQGSEFLVYMFICSYSYTTVIRKLKDGSPVFGLLSDVHNSATFTCTLAITVFLQFLQCLLGR